ncbi:6-aminohexanoate-dimer hydrolase [Aquisphaera giovannonii]|uniref:6-aminohexanoate-dimer hydrolase n=1 Tax=Aquisphaera giovannonii TaxID=406548 RepID=A0A5B9VYJ3_9BACT|nr:serine hydrolase [Aquisphaera giovannonii]QEH33382.1 6-aminohexanoate-dimer hydrolase [Aquisphaera giovannonii]
MRAASLLAFVILLPSFAGASDLPRSRPEDQGVSTAALLGFVEAANRIETMNSVMVFRHGQIVAEGWWAPYSAETPHSLYSLSKSFTSTAVGLAISEGKLSLDDPILKFFPEDAPTNPGPNLKAMRISDLLRMSTGHQTEPQRTKDEPWTKSFLAHPVPFKPGTHFLYNTSATYMLSAIVQKVTGQRVLDYLTPRLFEPLGIEHPTWEQSPQGVDAGGYGLSIRTEDIAKFGQLLLQKGKWHGKQLVPAEWIEAATARQTSNGSSPTSDWDQGYGYQFWRCRHGAFRGDGAFGQYCVVLPEQDAVVAITSGVKDMQAVLNVVWEKLLPAFRTDAQPRDDDAYGKLASALKGLHVEYPQGTGKPANVAGRMFAFDANPMKLESLSIQADERGDTLVIRAAGKEGRIRAGHGDWTTGPAAIGPMSALSGGKSDWLVGAASAWTADETLTVKACFIETPFIATFRLKFSGDEVRLNASNNVGFGATRAPELVGKAEHKP